MSEFRSPTAFAFPVSKDACSTPEDCVLFAIKKIQQRLKTKTILHRSLFEACCQLFGESDLDWFDGAIATLTRAGAVINENAGLENVAPTYFVKLERTVIKQSDVKIVKMESETSSVRRKASARKKSVPTGKKLGKTFSKKNGSTSLRRKFKKK